MSDQGEGNFDETSDGHGDVGDTGRCSEAGAGESTPLQCRASFFQNWSWASVANINEGLCKRAGATFGASGETHRTVAESWENRRNKEVTFEETLDFLKHCHRSAPFLNFNGNTFAEIGRAFVGALLVGFPTPRARLMVSAVGHYIAGTLDKKSLSSAFSEMANTPTFEEGMRVKTLKGSLFGVVTGFSADGLVIWKADGSNTTFKNTPSTLLPASAPDKQPQESPEINPDQIGQDGRISRTISSDAPSKSKKPSGK